MNKTLKKIALLSVAILGAACAPSTSSSSESTQASSGSSGSSDEKIVIYSNSVSNGRGDWLKEKAAENGFNIEFVSVNGGELADRVIAEKNNAIADMIFGLNNMEFNRLKDENLLEKYEPSWKSEVDLSLGDADGLFYPLVVQPLVLIGNESSTMPKDWTDLAKPEYKGKYNIFKLSGGTSKVILGSIASRYRDDSGELGVSKEGWDVIKGYAQNAKVVASETDYIGMIIDKKDGIEYNMMWGSGYLQNKNERKYNFNVMYPEVGEPFVTEQIGILNTSKKKETVQKFINWFGSAEVQAEWSKKFSSIPANKKALEQANDDVKEFMSKVKSQKLDWEFISKNISSWVEKVELEFLK